MDYRCDIYVYEDVAGGITLHVAGARTVLGPEDMPPPLPARPGAGASDTQWWQDWYERDRKMLKLMDKAERKPIGLSRDGQTWRGLSFGEAADLLRSLRAEGYVMPEGLEDEIENEGRETQDEE